MRPQVRDPRKCFAPADSPSKPPQERPVDRLVLLAASALLCLNTGCFGPSARKPVPISTASLQQLELLATNAAAIGYSFTNHEDHDEIVFPKCRFGFHRPLVSVPLIAHRLLPTLRARINDRHTLEMILDTGAEFTLLEARDAIAAAVRTVSTDDLAPATVRGVRGQEPARAATLDLLTLGELYATNVAAVVLLHEAHRSGAPLAKSALSANILGMIPLSNFCFVTFDYPAHRVTFSPEQEFQPPTRDSGTSLPLVSGKGGLFVTIGLPGGHKTAVLVDTGMGGMLHLNKETIQHAGLEKALADGYGGKAGGLGDAGYAVRYFNLDLVELGRVRCEDVEASTLPAVVETGLEAASSLISKRRSISKESSSGWKCPPPSVPSAK